MAIRIQVPQALSFDDLRIAFNPDGVQFNRRVIDDLCRANELNPVDIAGDSRRLVALIAAWYNHERSEGGAHSPTVERLVCGTDAAVEEFVVTRD